MSNRLRRWLYAIPLDDPIERRQGMLVQVILLGLCSVLLFSALITLIAYPFTTGALAAGNLRNTISNVQGALLVAAPLILLRRGHFRIAVAILMAELFLLAFSTFYSMGLEQGWIGALEFALPISLGALALGRRWLLAVYLASIAGVAATALTWYPLVANTARNAPSAIIAFALIAGLLAVFLDRFGTAFRESLASLRESQERYRLITENAADLISLTDQTGRFVYASPSHQNVLGYLPERLIGSPAIEYVHLDDQSRWRTSGNPAPTLMRCRHTDGSWRWIEMRSTTVQRQEQCLLLTIGRDVTEQQQMEVALAQNYSLLSAVIDSTPDAVTVKRDDGRYLLMNAASARVLGRSASQLPAADDSAEDGSDIAGQLTEDEHRIIQRGEMQQYEETATVEGIVRTYLTSKGPYRDQQGNVASI